ncbi:MAG: ferredoxin, partial [Lentisphaeria bacterium]|nr:ferredoxin [Lentisphaeria bacterium]
EYLEAAIGTDGVDAAALSHILTQRDYAATMPESRQIRIAEVLDTFNRTHSRLEQNEFAAVCRAHNTDAATGRFAVLARTLVEYFRAVRIAQLEIDSHYREDRHDAWFARFSWDYVSPEERALCPPLLVSVGAEAIDETLLSLLATKLPVKILARIADVHHASGMVTQLAAGMLATGSAYVLQAGTADTRLLKTGISDGLRYSGPALFCIDEGGAGESSAAVRSRAFPAFICNPAAGRTWAERLSIAATPDHQQDWALENVTYTAADGSVTTMEMPFTLADCLAADTRFAAHFAVATKYRHNAAMMPVGDFIELDPGDTADRIPYILMASRSGVLEHVIVTTAVITEMRKCVSRWRYLQELGGVNNSHVLSRMGAVEAQLEARHQEDLQVAREATRQSVVERITAGLLGLGPTDVMPTVAPLPLPDTTETPQVDGTAAGDIGASPPPANDAAVIEPYIDSLLCTTCNECTNINNRLFAYDESKQAYIRDPAAGTYRHLVLAAEKCPIKIIHPGKPRNPDEKGVAALVKRAAPYNSV